MAPMIEHQPEDKKGPSTVMLIVALLVITLVAGGAGFGVSATMLTPAAMVTAAVPDSAAHGEKPANDHGAAKDEHGTPADGRGGGEPTADAMENMVVFDIQPITTNLGDPSDIWIRMELSLVFGGEADEIIAETVHQDIIAYMRTMRLYNLQGGSGYQHLIEDLEERAAIRSEGHVKRVLVRTLILE
jgi:flagellar protein FliL